MGFKAGVEGTLDEGEVKLVSLVGSENDSGGLGWVVGAKGDEEPFTRGVGRVFGVETGADDPDAKADV